ncbi:hypothetical protein [Peterkaempfera griseoplana]|uniref:hypothetical protein n=1 Tax=Peterkaempfera griseoplana TaxID=66896 RepID=UPI0007C79511|nr:hypothetical protein [Peterkaempfera griseoplana]
MSAARSTATVFLTLIGELALALLALVMHWAVWIWMPLTLLLLLVCLLTLVAGRRRTNPVPDEMLPHLPVAPVERREQRLTQVALPSAWPDYDFLFSATVRWCPTGSSVDEPVINPAGLAVEAVLARAREITEQRPPVRASLVQHELNGVLGRMRPDSTGFLQAMAETVTLVLSDHDQERLDKLAAVRKDKAVWEHERKYEQDRREYLGDDVLKDTGSAVVWWLSKNDDHVEKTVKDIGLLAQLSSAAQNEEVPEQFRHLVPQPAYPQPLWATGLSGNGHRSTEPQQSDERSAADCFDAFLLTMGLPKDDPQRSLLTRQIAEVITRNGRSDIAEELTRRFDAPCVPDLDDFPSHAGSADEEPHA